MVCVWSQHPSFKGIKKERVVNGLLSWVVGQSGKSNFVCDVSLRSRVGSISSTRWTEISRARFKLLEPESTVAGSGSGACAELRYRNREARLVAGLQGSWSFLSYLAGRTCLALCPSGLWDIWPITISWEKVRASWTTQVSRGRGSWCT